MNPHVHFHCCVTDVLFSAETEGVKFHGIQAITEEDLQRIQQTLRRRLIGLFKPRDLLEPDQAARSAGLGVVQRDEDTPGRASLRSGVIQNVGKDLGSGRGR